MATHHLDDTKPHAFWDNSYPARLRIQPGDTVVFETLEASAGQVGSDSPSEVVANLNFEVIHPLTGVATCCIPHTLQTNAFSGSGLPQSIYAFLIMACVQYLLV